MKTNLLQVYNFYSEGKYLGSIEGYSARSAYLHLTGENIPSYSGQWNENGFSVDIYLNP